MNTWWSAENSLNKASIYIMWEKTSEGYLKTYTQTLKKHSV